MTEIVISELPGLLREYLGPTKEIINTEICRLTGPGENYRSIMLKLDLKIRNRETGHEEVLNAVAKILKEEEEDIENKLDCRYTFKSEGDFYTKMVPALKEFQRKVGVEELIDWSAELYGARINLDGSDVVDENACLILENLNASGYINISRRQGFDFETAKLVLRSLASFHAVPLALKLHDPNEFENNIKALCPSVDPPSIEIMDNFLRKLLDENEKCKNKFPDVEVWPRKPEPREPFATIIHDDLWTNNTMQRFVEGKPVQNKILDFQDYHYGSPASDVYFLIFTSVNKTVLEQHLDDLIKYYHDNFVRILEAHGCETKPFTYESFLRELRTESKFEFGHTLFFSLIVRQSEESKLQTGPPTIEDMMAMVTDDARDHFNYIVDVCVERGWH